MTRRRRALLVALSALGYVGAATAAGAMVALRYRWQDPKVVDASSGMYAFGDFVMWLGIVGVLSLPPTWLLLRAVRELQGFWRALSWAGLSWAALVPVALAIRVVGTLAGPPSPVRAAPMALALADAFSVVRLLATPAALPGLALACWACAPGPSRRRLLWAVGLEGAGVAAYALWIAWALVRAGR